MYRTGLLILLGLAIMPSVRAQNPDPLRGLVPKHPRLFLREGDAEALAKGLPGDEVFAAWRKRLLARADVVLKEAPVEHKLIGPRLLDQSRKALDRVGVLSMAFRLTGKKAYLDRCVVEMRAAGSFKDWNPSHFLDTAEMTCALAIGYDWLYNDLSREERDDIRKAIVSLGLKAGLDAYDAKAWWMKNHNNWNQVCFGGLVAGALAIADEEPDIARKIIGPAIENAPIAMRSWGPDGGWEEGPGYWGYAMRYNVFLVDALDSALGDDCGLSKIPGFAEAGNFRLHGIGPTQKAFNFADGNEGAGGASSMLWLARRFGIPAYATGELPRLTKDATAFGLLYYWRYRTEARVSPPTTRPQGLDSVFSRVQVACFRSSWSDPDAIYLAIKGGDNTAGHSHLDLGTFVLDALGQRWGFELGPDDYNIPGYFGKKRWDYYRLNTHGQNTAVLDGKNQKPTAAARLVGQKSGPDGGEATFDLSAAWGNPVKSLVRTAGLRDQRREAFICDTLEATSPVDYLWQMHTRAEVTIKGNRATLTQGGKTLVAVLEDAPVGAIWDVVSAERQPPENPNTGVRKLVVRFPEKVKSASIKVAFRPGAER